MKIKKGITAKKAFNVAFIKSDRSLSYILKEIKRRAKTGHFSTYINGRISDSAISELRKRGFEVRLLDKGQEKVILEGFISWEKGGKV